MPFDDLTHFLQAAVDARDLIRVEAPLSPIYEIAAATEALCQDFRDESPVILFENVTGSELPVATNLLGSRSRFLRALSAESLDDVLDRLSDQTSSGQAASFSLLPGLGAERSPFAPRTIRRGLCQQVVKMGREIDLADLPALHGWPGESGPAITSAILLMRSETGATLMESVPLEVTGRSTLLAHLEPDQHAARLLRQAARSDTQTAVAMVLGGDPLLTWLAARPWPCGSDMWQLAGRLRQASVNLIRCRTVELDVPAEAEIVLEGLFDPSQRDGTGSLAGESGLIATRTGLASISLTAITHRTNPIFPAMVRSHAFHEGFVSAALTERLALRQLRALRPIVIDLHLPGAGAHRNAVYVSVESDDPRLLAQLSDAIGGLPILSAAQLVVLVPGDVDVRDESAVWRQVCLGLERAATAADCATQSTAIPWGGSSRRLVIDAITPAPNSLQMAVAGGAALDQARQQLALAGWVPLRSPIAPPVVSTRPLSDPALISQQRGE